MNKILLLISILAFASFKELTVKNYAINIGVNTTFDKDHVNFTLNYTGEKNDVMLLYIEYDKIISYIRECRLHYSGHITTQGTEYAKLLTPEYNCHYRFSTGEDKIGSFVIYAFKKELNIKLKNKYGNLNLPVYLKEKKKRKKLDISQLTFSVPNFERNATAVFEFNNTIIIDEKNYDMENPFKVCHGGICTTNLDSYDFNEGESYTITVKVTKVTEDNFIYYIIPGFTFYDINYNGTYSPDDIIDIYSEDNSDILKVGFILILLLLIF